MPSISRMLYLGHVFPGQYSFKVYNATANLNWEFVKRLRDTVTGKRLLKRSRWGDRGRYREAGSMGTRRVWPTWCRSRFGNIASRIKNNHAAGRNAFSR